uniref:Nonsense-mediated mRNA decay factor SMG8 n=1 Tax=Globodera rostochiensis TaxID=31243 RepID=A0A914HX63_GLORO
MAVAEEEVFFDKWSYGIDTDKSISVEAFYDEDESVLWLLLNGIYDVCLQHRIFGSEQSNGKSFFEKLSEIESTQQRFMLFIFSISHMVLFVEQACRFDLDWINILEEVNRNRLRSFNVIRTALSQLPEEMSKNEKLQKELLEKMEKCIESQVSHFMRQHGIIDSRYPGNALGQITISSGAPFVYIFNHNEMPKDVNNEFAMSLYPEESLEEFNVESIQKLITNVLGLSPKNKDHLSRSDYNFDYFLHAAILNVRKRIVDAAKFLKRIFVDGTDGLSMPFSRQSFQEIDTLKSIIDSAVSVGMSLYVNQLNQQPDITGGGDSAFSPLEHNFTLNLAIEQLIRRCPRAVGTERRKQMIEKLSEDCATLWMDGHRRCDQISLTGQLCHFAVHDLPNEKVSTQSCLQDEKRPQKGHCSGVKTYSMCNCGLSRQIRTDPFSLKEANYAFYLKSDVTFGNCCADLDRYEFHLFDFRDTANCSPNIDEDLDRTTIVDDQKLKGSSPNGLKEEIETNLEVDEDENLAIDPKEFNFRFFDDEDDAKIPSDEELRQREEHVPIDPMTQEEAVMGKAFSGDDVGEEMDEHRRKERIESTEEDEECLDEEAEDELSKQTGEEESSRPITPAENVDYLENYDVYDHGKRRSDSTEQSEKGNFGRERTDNSKLLEKYKGRFLDHVPHSKSPPELLPLFPSFSVICIGHSSLGSEFLLPWSVQLTVRTEQWLRELQFIGATPTERTFRNLQHQRNYERSSNMTSKEKVKLFIGFDYECPRGHRFMIAEPGKVLRHRRMSGSLKTDAAPLMDNDLAIWMPCPCKKEPRMSAQLMRIHIVTPKAPVSVSVQPLIQMPNDDGFFFPGQSERIELGWAKYYVMRLPYVYKGPSGTAFHRPNLHEFRGKLLRSILYSFN